MGEVLCGSIRTRLAEIALRLSTVPHSNLVSKRLSSIRPCARQLPGTWRLASGRCAEQSGFASVSPPSRTQQPRRAARRRRGVRQPAKASDSGVYSLTDAQLRLGRRTTPHEPTPDARRHGERVAATTGRAD